jgi:hypothetical protein
MPRVLQPPSEYVFGDAAGRRVVSVKTAWLSTCRRANVADLHFHDLRREAASRWMDAGVPLGTIQRWLGHTNIAQTSTYLGASLGNDAAEMQRFEAHRVAQLSRLAADDVAHRGIIDAQTGPDAPTSDTEKSEMAQQVLNGFDPDGVVH